MRRHKIGNGNKASSMELPVVTRKEIDRLLRILLQLRDRELHIVGR